jgi:HlyD family secretion protein
MKHKRARIAVVLTLLGGGAAAWHFGWLGGEGNAKPAGALVLYGNVDIRQVDLGFRVPGRIAEVHFEEGDAVSAGELLATLDQQPYRDALALAQAEVARASANLEKLRTGTRPQEIAQAQALVEEREAALANAVRLAHRRAELVKQELVAPEAHDDAVTAREEAAARLQAARDALALAQEGFRREDIAAAAAELQAAEARVQQAQTNFDDTRLVAPSLGTVLTRVREPGAVVAAGEPVYAISLKSPIWVRAYVAEPDLARLRPGMAAEIATDTRPDARYLGHIGFISPVAEFTPKSVETPQLRTDLVYRLRIIVDDPDDWLRQGMPVTVHLPEAAPGS